MVTKIVADRSVSATKGPACALAAPAALVFRQFFVGGCGQKGDGQLDLLHDVGAVLGNCTDLTTTRFWRVQNGYCLPTTGSSAQSPGSMAQVAALLERDAALAERARAALRLGVHWSTEVHAPRTDG